MALAEGHSSAVGWRATAWVTGLASAGAGTVVVISDGLRDGISLGLGIGEIALGTASIWVAIAAGFAPDAPPRPRRHHRWNVSPTTLRDVRGDAAPGLQLNLTSF